MIKAKINQIRRAHSCALFAGHKFIGQTCHSTFLKNTNEGKMVVLHLYLQEGQKTGGQNGVRMVDAHFSGKGSMKNQEIFSDFTKCLSAYILFTSGLHPPILPSMSNSVTILFLSTNALMTH